MLPRISEVVRLRLDIAYDGTEFAGWAPQSGQRTVAGVLDEALTTVFRTPMRLRAAGRTDAGVHATGQVAHVDVPVDALANAHSRSPRLGDPEFLPLVRRLGRFLPDRRPGARHRPRPSGFRRPVLGAAASLRVPAVDGALRCAAAAGPLHHRLAPRPGCRRDGRRVARPAGAARLCGVLPSSRERHHHPRPAAPGLEARRRPDHGARHRRRVLLVDGALVGGGAAGRGRAPASGVVVPGIAHRHKPFQRLRGRAAARADAGERRLSAR